MSNTLRKTADGFKVPEGRGVIKKLAKKGFYGIKMTSQQIVTKDTTLICEYEDEQLQKFINWCNTNNHIPKEITSVDDIISTTYCEFSKSIIEEYKKTGIFHYCWTCSKPTDATVKFFSYSTFCEKELKSDKKRVSLKLETKYNYHNCLKKENIFPNNYPYKSLSNKQAANQKRIMAANYQIKTI